jgi:serine/threonine-protein kinase
MSQLTHPNSVAVFDYGHSLDGTFYYAMEYLGGGIDLDDLVRRRGPQPSGRVANILAQVCGALHEAHLAKLIHRDVKPANIILCERGGMPDVAKVLDYGLVKDFTVDRDETGQVVVGTPGFMAPEAVTDPGNIGPAVDIYALGAVGYFLVTGQQVFTGNTAVEICIAHVTKEVTPPSQVTDRPVAPDLEALIMKCLAKAPSDRFTTALDLRAALLALPASTDWSMSEARAWWLDYRGREQKASESAQQATMTMQIDLAAAART